MMLIVFADALNEVQDFLYKADVQEIVREWVKVCRFVILALSRSACGR